MLASLHETHSTSDLLPRPLCLRLDCIARLQEAHAARDMLQGYKLDKSHTFVVNMFDEFEQFAKVPDQYEEPEEKPYRPMENLQVSQSS